MDHAQASKHQKSARRGGGSNTNLGAHAIGGSSGSSKARMSGNKNGNSKAHAVSKSTKSKAHATGSESANKTSKRHLKKNTKIIICVLAALAGVYVAGALLFLFVFMPGTSLNKHNVSLMTRTDAAELLDTTCTNYVLDISGDDFNGKISGKDINIAINQEATVDAAIAQTYPFAWPITLFMNHQLGDIFRTVYDRDAAQDILGTQITQFNKGKKAPVSADISYVSSEGTFNIVDEQPGSQLSFDTVWARTQEALLRLNDSIALDQADLLQPPLKATDPVMQGSVARARAMLQAAPTITMDGKPYQQISGDQVAEWLSVDDSGNITVDGNAVSYWCKHNLSQTLNTVGSKRSYTRPDNKKVSVKGGTYGWSVNTATLAQDIVNALESAGASGSPTTIEVSIKSRAQQPPDAGGKDWGNTYLDIDLAEQKAYYFVDGSLAWSSAIVSGNPNNGHGTPQGVYTINNNFNKGHPATTLRGNIDPETGQPEYESPVQYWMPFIGGSIGLHDASWRNSFGGSIYKSDGSHGCVNLPTKKAQELCKMIDRGLVVVSHY